MIFKKSILKHIFLFRPNLTYLFCPIFEQFLDLPTLKSDVLYGCSVICLLKKTVKAKTLSCLIWTFFVVNEIWREGYFQIHVNFITMILWDIILIHGCFIKRRKFKFSFFPCLFLYKNPIIHVIKTRRLDSTIWSM